MDQDICSPIPSTSSESIEAETGNSRETKLAVESAVSLTITLSLPVFWPAKEIVSFLKCSSDELDIFTRGGCSTKRYKHLEQVLQENAGKIFAQNWKTLLTPEVENYAIYSKMRITGYNGDFVKDLLRFIRNTGNHYLNLDPAIQDELGNYPHEFIAYYIRLFPNLIPILYAAVLQTGILEESLQLREFYLENTELPYNLNDFDALADALINGIKYHILTGGLRKRYTVKTEGESCKVIILRLPDGILPIVFTHANIHIQISDGFITIHHAFRNLQDSKILLQMPIKSDFSLTIILGRNEVLTSSEWKVPTNTAQVLVFSDIKNPIVIDNAIVNAFEKNGLIEVPLRWEELEHNYQNTLLHRNVLFQGCEVTLGDIFTWVQNPKIIETLKASTLHGEFLQSLIEDSKPVILYPSVPNIIPYYIDRLFCPSKFLPFKILSDNVRDLFVIGSVDEELSNLLKKLSANELKTMSSISAISSETLSPSLIIVLEDETHLEIIGNKTKLAVHFLKFHGGFLEWMKTWGSNELIRRNVQSISISEQEFLRFIQRKSAKNQPIIIGDSPGMGKTTILFNSANQLIKSNPLKIVKFYTLTEFVSEVERRVGNPAASLEEIKDSIVAILCQQSKAHPLYNQLISSFIKAEKSESSTSQKIMVELMLDGLDEVDSSQWKLALKILLSISQFNKVRLWITTRLQHLKFLEWTFSSTMSYYLTKLKRNDQVSLLTRYWSQDMDSDEKEFHYEKLEKIANYCLNHSPKDYMDIAGIPLQCRLLAEVHELKVNSLLKQEGPFLEESKLESLKIHSVLDLYDKVIETKLHIQLEKQCGTQKYIKALRITKREQETMNVGHERKALELLMPRWLDSFVSSYFFTDKLSLEELLAYGIVECIRRMTGEPDDDDGNQNAFYFLHRTIAEYFIAHFIVQLLYWEGPATNDFLLRIGDFLVQEILKLEDFKKPQDPEYYPSVPQPPKVFVHDAVIIKFFNAMLQQRKADNISSQMYSAIFQSLLKLENWADHLVDLLFLLVHTDKLVLFRIIKHSLEQDDVGNTKESSGEGRKLQMFIKECSQTKLGDLVCSAVRKCDLNLIQSICNLVENGGVPLNQIPYQREIYSWGKEASRKSSPLEPLRLALSNTLNYELVQYLVVDKGFAYSPERSEFWGVGVLQLCIHQISGDYFILKKGDSCLAEGLKIIEFFVSRNRDVLEEDSKWFDHLPTTEYDNDFPPLYESRENALLTPLVYAAALGAPLRVLQTLINLGADVNAKVNVDNKTLLHFMGYRHSHTRIGIEHEQTVQDLHNVTTWAFTHGYNPELRALEVFKLPFNSDLRKLKVYKRTFLHMVVGSYHDLLPATIQLFKNYNVDFNADDGMGSSVLDIAIQKQAPPETIQALLNAGSQLQINEKGKNALHIAIEYCNFPAVKYFIEGLGFKVNGKCGKGCTPLHYAVTASPINPSQVEIVEYLLSKDANINALNRVGTPPFMAPFRKRCFASTLTSSQGFEILKLLVKRGAKLRKNMCNEIIFRIFMVECSYIRKSDAQTMISFLQFATEKGGNIHYRFKDGKTFLHLACGLELFEAVKWLVEDCGLGVNVRDKKGKLPIDYVDLKDIHRNQRLQKIATYLIQKGCICNFILKVERPCRRVAEDFLAD